MSLTRRTCISTLTAGGVAAIAAPMISPARAGDKIAVSVMSIAECAPIYLGKEKGFFSKRNLDLALTTRHGGPVIIAGVLSGELQFGFSNIPSLLKAEDAGATLVGIASGSASTGVRGNDFLGVIAPADSPIKDAKDLAGKTIGLNDLNNMGDVALRAAVRLAGGDTTSIKYVQVPFPDMPAAIANQRIDAAVLVEPFLTIAVSKGAKVVDWALVDISPKLMMSLYFTSNEYAEGNPDVVKRFKEAILESLAYAEAHSDEVRKIIPTFTRITPEVAQKIMLSAFPTEMNPKSTQILADLCLKDGIISKKADLTSLLSS
jgi:NitT/TauT family transport system substrate-binding protein